ncbi:YchJ family metal-binding protein [Agromyces sp. H3Y2-19a]|uniref:YchJ family protein n=1 Tax=Agromyces TaxID=33877 RepID=UPI0023B9EDCB|nr:YchJ family metal-binding protein [Agromyces chromiiresistens]MDF0513430.1 YchJ family metal-binding protein [Agromyces chromiiresistens]
MLPADDAEFPTPAAEDRCPCLSGLPFGECCGRLIDGEAHAPTAEQLMRSRYTAFVIGAAAYLLETWHPTTRPAALELDPSIRWLRLEIERAEHGGPFDREGLVEFTAHYRHHGERGSQHETSRFARLDGRWTYLDSVV